MTADEDPVDDESGSADETGPEGAAEFAEHHTEDSENEPPVEQDTENTDTEFEPDPTSTDQTAQADDEGPSMAGILGAEQPEADGEEVPPRPTIEPESLSPENVVFVVLGVVGSLLVVYRLVTLF